ncbi:hypothetical protein HG535_0D04900 [Zygotorulaspora mrakii]|uniref:DNA polymerase eta n=1 Tax=Zygotorulaspora mrakii TaxID=42260 RepID=A0A7H9B2A0_ZYGMR|nr:uncharacterized protein HG535_0D04900 [Zygotorulaspora mrakii]QLG72781.1 hypothetical protein HG535_0D04900 [Zygotorulaspora mrakii]
MSKFKWSDLIKLNSKEEAYISPLAVLSHIDANAFFAQVEEVRCGYTKDAPVVCVQWNSIIAVSYAARKYGISRMDTIQQALKKSDKIIPIHTAVFRKGEDFWQYHDGCGSWMEDKDKQLPNELYKVSLDPYRRESRKIFKIFTQFCDLAEKASVDEVFLDLGRLCFQKLMFSKELIPHQKNAEDLERIREIFINGQYQLDAYLPQIPDSLRKIKFEGDVYNPNAIPLIDDWDDVLLALGSQLTQLIREQIEKSLGYTTSCGVAKTKTVCKLASNFKKPNAQTVILNRCTETFLDCGKFEITSFWSLGGLLGKELIDALNAPNSGSIKFIREKWSSSPNDLKQYIEVQLSSKDANHKSTVIERSKIGSLAEKLFALVRGDYWSPLTPQTMVKSMMSNKNMNGDSCKTLVDCISWLEVFSGELSSRLHELEQEYDKTVIPRTVTVLVRTKSGLTHSKSGPLTKTGSKIDSQCLLKVGSKLIMELGTKFGKEVQYYPLQNINMSVSHFEVFSSKKSIVDMFGNQAQILESDDPATRSVSPAIVDPGRQPCLSSEVKFECQPCRLTFATEKHLQEHRDYHVAMRLSENINGADENSQNISIGEKRLLLTKRTPSTPVQSHSIKRIKTKGPKGIKQTKKSKPESSNGIMKYFSKQ